MIELYRIQNGQRQYLLRHFIYKFGADHNNEFTDRGTFKIQGDSLIFYTEYKQKTGLDPIPLAGKQVYKVTSEGKLILLYNKERSRGSLEWEDARNKSD